MAAESMSPGITPGSSLGRAPITIMVRNTMSMDAYLSTRSHVAGLDPVDIAECRGWVAMRHYRS